MLSGEGNAGERSKNNNRSNQQKSNLARAAHFFCTFLCLCFARLQREMSVNFLVTRFMEEMSYVFSLTFYSLSKCRLFSPRQPVAFLIFSPPLQNFMLFLQQKMSPLFFLSRSMSFSRVPCPLTFSFSFSFSFSAFKICAHDN